MGICKGCGIVVTSLYCYAHRVNVCESCIVGQHSRCVVQSYKRWLEDVDYDPSCPLCHSDMERGEVVRLVCHDLFHLDCLKKFTQEHGESTPVCPLCSSPIVPPDANVSPIAQNLRSHLPQLVPGIEMTFDLNPPAVAESSFARPRGEMTQQLNTHTPQSRHSVSEQITIESAVQSDSASFEELAEDKYEKRVKQKLGFSRAPWKRTYTSFSVCSPKVVKLICICILLLISFYLFSLFLSRARRTVVDSQIIKKDLFFKVGQ